MSKKFRRNWGKILKSFEDMMKRFSQLFRKIVVNFVVVKFINILSKMTKTSKKFRRNWGKILKSFEDMMKRFSQLFRKIVVNFVMVKFINILSKMTKIL